MNVRTAAQERRSGIRLIVIGAFLMALAFGGWWLVETTNPSGDHDAHLLPIFALIPVAMGLFHLYRARLMARHDGATTAMDAELPSAEVLSAEVPPVETTDAARAHRRDLTLR